MSELDRVILIDDEQSVRMAISQTLELEDFDVMEFASAQGVADKIAIDWPGVIVSDINLPGMSGLELFEQVKKIDPEIPFILITGHGDISMAVTAIRDGAYDFIEKPFSNDDFIEVVRRASEKRRLTLENRNLRLELAAQNAPGPRIIGNTPGIHRLRQALLHVADTGADILVQGETGTGKEMVARFIHEHSSRRGKPFVAINCGAVPDSIMESELFGHEKGAFTDAKTQRIGKIEHSNGGTLFLDEIESMPMSMQIRLLRVLEERKVERLGSNKGVDLDLRILAATKVDLKELSETGTFREDLYYRLNVVRVDIPPLRERKDDIPLLWQHFCLVATAQYKRESEELSAERMHSLMSYDWPGNVRELRNLAERYVLMGEAGSFEFDQIITNETNPGFMTLPEQMERFEKTLLEQELKRQKGSIKDTMDALGLPRKTLYDKMRKYDLDKDLYKS
ncbi:sigma-54-dependent transcriptional regulator [Marinomonas communis]|jgi:two-component system C4-dicarboxylate transport response regulator DctD|uniref:Two-component system C4-dicarboxylate transport response regulator DctD n=1 Tax=Marinomonas communis TaxID=28254 RepID=A0A4R6X5F1_9GAMM|nr:sigma-54 dependent transcriptional regulator [Marinomonas communis]MCC4275830.1 sigma-54 dependent transcriptional regulator [Marinomonas communis]TDR12670.1 two-component system C4-dicarboxylate transport response regulator DctD [Marinomonas communis]